MRHAQIRLRLAALILQALKLALPVQHHDYQEEGLTKKLVPWLRKKGRALAHRAHFAWATGLGKTVEFMTVAKACEGHLRLLIIVPTKQLLVQTVENLTGWTNGSTGHIGDVPHVLDEDGEVISLKTHKHFGKYEVIVCVAASFKRRAAQIKKELDPQVIIWDECHGAYSDLSQDSLDLFDEAVILGFSATPDYLTTTCKPDYIPVTLDNGVTLYADPDRMARAHFGECLDERSVRWGIENGYLAPFAWGRIEFKVSLKGVKTVVGPDGIPDYEQAALHKLLSKNWKEMMKVMTRVYQSGQYNLRERATVAICPGKAEAEKLTEAMNRIGVPSACITDETDHEERRKILEGFEEGRIKLITSIFILREGWDSKRAEVCLFLRPTKSRVLYVQFMGRVLRLDLKNNPDKVALVLDPLFQDMDFAPLSAPVLFGLPGQEIAQGDIIIPPKKRRRKTPSPYLSTDRLEPILVVERPEIEYWADEEGVALIDGVERMTAKGYARRIGTADVGAVNTRIESSKLVPVYAKASNGRNCQFYSIVELDEACASLRQSKAGTDGIVLLDEVPHITMNAYAVRQKIDPRTVATGVASAGLVAKWSRDKAGVERSLYPLSELDALFSRADEKGVLVIDGIKCIKLTSYAESIGVNKHETVLTRARQAKIEARKGKDFDGHERDFYPLDSLDAACGDLKSAKADSRGILMLGEVECMTVGAYAKSREIDGTSAQRRVDSHGLEKKPGRDSLGRARPFYAIAELDSVCADLIAKRKKTQGD